MVESYMQKLYRTNPKFRAKQKAYANKWAKDHREEKNKASIILYANRTPEQIKKRQKYLKKLRKIRKERKKSP